MRASLRYAPLLVVIAVIACAPAWLFALRQGQPPDLAAAKSELKLTWTILGLGIAGQLWLVGAAAPLLRDASVTMRTAPRIALAGLFAAIGPWLVSIVAIGVGLAALVVPGVMLLGLFATAAAGEPGTSIATRLASSAAATRALPRRVINAVLGVLAIDTLLAIAVRAVIVHPLPGKPTAADFASIRLALLVLASGLVLVAPVAAGMLATVRSDAEGFQRRA